MKRKYLVAFTETRKNEEGFNVPVLPWDGMEGLNTYWTTTVDQEGNFVKGYVIAVVAGKDLSKIDSDPNVTILPEVDEQKKVSEVSEKELADLKRKSKELGLDIDRIKSDEKIQDVLTVVGKQVQAKFDAATFDIQDVV